MTDLQKKMAEKLGLTPDDFQPKSHKSGRVRSTSAIYCADDRHTD